MKQGIIQKAIGELKRKYSGSDLTERFLREKLGYLEVNLLDEIKQNADYDGNVYTGTLIGEYFDKHDYLDSQKE